MARIRTIKPEFFTSEDIVSLSPLARLLYIAIWCEADKEGRMAWKPLTFKLRYFPADDCDINSLCEELTARNLVVPYGNGYAYIPSFKAHQHINPRESASQIPEPNATVTRRPRVGTRHSRASDAQVGREGKGKEGKDNPPTPPGGDDDDLPGFAEFWDAWPKNDRKQDRAKCSAKWAKEKLDSVSAKIMADVEAKKRTQKWREGFVEAPLVYLNNRRWEDGEAASAPDWWMSAGFETVWQAQHAGCNSRNAHQFRDGKRVEVAA